MNVIRIAWVADMPAHPLEALADGLGPMEATEFAALSHPGRQRGFLLSRALLRHLVAATPALHGAALRFARAGSGRLLLTAPVGWHISLSHGRGRAAAILAPVPCGVDIEAPRDLPFRRLAARYFSPEENAGLDCLESDDARRVFFRLWTLKEAAAKALGEGLAGNMARLGFSLDTPLPRLRDPSLGVQAWQGPAGDAWLAAAAVTPAAVRWECEEVKLDALR